MFKKKRCLPFFSSSSSGPFIWGQGYYSLLERFLSVENSSHKYSSQIVPRLSPLFILDKSHCINNVLYYPALSLLPLWRQSLLELLVIQISLPVRNASNIILLCEIIRHDLFKLEQIFCSIRSCLLDSLLCLMLTRASVLECLFILKDCCSVALLESCWRYSFIVLELFTWS